MTSTSAVHLGELGNGTSSASRDPIMYKATNTKGCYVTRSKGALAFALVVCVCVLLVIVTYYLHPDYNKNSSDDVTAAPGASDAAMTSAAPTRAPAAAELRLPTDLLPRHYNLRLRPDIYQEDPSDFHFEGTCEYVYMNCTYV